jgi:hypothetical protein
MADEAVRLRPIEEADLADLSRLDTDPAVAGPFQWAGFASPRTRQRRWEEDGLLGRDSSMLGIALPDGKLAGFVSWRTIRAGGPDGDCLEIGAMVFPEHRGQEWTFLGTRARQRPGHDLLICAASGIVGPPSVPGAAERRISGRASATDADAIPRQLLPAPFVVHRGGEGQPGCSRQPIGTGGGTAGGAERHATGRRLDGPAGGSVPGGRHREPRCDKWPHHPDVGFWPPWGDPVRSRR